MPLSEVAYVAGKKGCEAIVLSGSMEPDTKVIENDLAELVASTEIPVFVGGQSSVAVCEAINRTGATALGQEILAGLNRLKAYLAEEK